MSGHESKDLDLTVRREALDDLTCLIMESRSLACGVIPDIGGKMFFLTDKRTGREWLRPADATYRRLEYGASFENFDRSGFDECFPAIASGDYVADPWKGTVIPDHGELWTIPWKWQQAEAGLRLQANGVHFPYIFSKEISLRDDVLLISYRVGNPTPYTMPCFWSAHPLFLIREGMKVLLPPHSKMIIDYSRDERLGRYLERITWPVVTDRNGKAVNLSLLGGREGGTADKLYACHLQGGYCALFDPGTGDYVGFTFDEQEIPHVGVWLNQGGWPFSGEPDCNVALEPCNGYPDRLGAGEHMVLPAHGELRWQLELHLGKVETEEAVRQKLAS